MPKIKEMFAFIAEDEGPDDEGLVAASIGGALMPLVGADIEIVRSLRPMAREIAIATGKNITLVHFSTREDLEVITPLIGKV